MYGCGVSRHCIWCIADCRARIENERFWRIWGRFARGFRGTIGSRYTCGKCAPPELNLKKGDSRPIIVRFFVGFRETNSLQSEALAGNAVTVQRGSCDGGRDCQRERDDLRAGETRDRHASSVRNERSEVKEKVVQGLHKRSDLWI